MTAKMIDMSTLCLTIRTSKGTMMYKFYFNNTFVVMVINDVIDLF